MRFASKYSSLPDNRDRISKEARALVTKYIATTTDLGSMWLQPPLVFCALGDPAQGRVVAQCMLAAARNRALPVASLLTQKITKEAVTQHELYDRTPLRRGLEHLAAGSTLMADD